MKKQKIDHNFCIKNYRDFLNEIWFQSLKTPFHFSLSHIKESFSVAFKRRQGGIRHVVIILISLFGLNSFANNGISNVNIQYARAKFTWAEGSDSFNKAGIILLFQCF